MPMKSMPNTTGTEEIQYYFRSACSASCVIFGMSEKRIRILLVKREKEPYKGLWSLPSGMVYPNDSIEERVDAIITTYAGTTRFYKKQIRAFADTSRHPLGRVIGIGYYGFVNIDDCQVSESQNPHEAAWYDLRSVPELAFDHNEIVAAANRRLLAKMSTMLAGFEMLPVEFTLKQLQELYEAALGHELDKRNFRRKILAQEVIIETGRHLEPWHESGKAPMLYTVDKQRYETLKAEGYKFEIF
jgi:8-oxo-dGTP diphosphatase